MKKYDLSTSFTFDGKRYKIRGDTKEELIRKMVNKQRDLEEGKVVVGGNMTVSEWAFQCIETYKTNQSEVTRKAYVNRMKHNILEHIGKFPLKKVKSIHCQQALNLTAGYSKRHVKEVYQIMNFIFKKAVENKLIIENPAAHLQMPNWYTSSRRSITDKERTHLLEFLYDDRYRVFALMYHCGLRPSEARECQGFDIKEMKDNKGIKYYVLSVRGTKTKNAIRFVPIPDELYQLIKDTPAFSYIAPNMSGNKHTLKSYERAWASLRRDMNLSMGADYGWARYLGNDGKEHRRKELIGIEPLAKDLVPYCLRHTFCTDLQKKGIDIRTAQYLMGHSDITLTANIYTHADNETILAAAKIIREAL